jgi:hypothetical protein
MGKPNKPVVPQGGADIASPTRVSKPAPYTYKHGHKMPANVNPHVPGAIRARGRYGQNRSDVPSSVGVAEASKLSKFCATAAKDPILESLVSGGHNDHSATGDAVKDLQRKISDTPPTPSYGMRNRSGDNVGPGKLGGVDWKELPTGSESRKQTVKRASK